MRPDARFVALEGIDGAGKTTTVRLLGQIVSAEHDLVVIEKKTFTFPDPLVSVQMGRLHQLLWPDGSEDPFYRLGASHWMHLMGAWFSTLDHALITPTLSSGLSVVIDSWIFKFMARLSTKGVLSDVIDDVFRHIRRPDLVIYLDVSPNTAVTRKKKLTIGESGNPRHGVPTEAGFIRHQREIRDVLDKFALDDGWMRLEVDNEPVEAVTRTVLEAILQVRPPVRR